MATRLESASTLPIPLLDLLGLAPGPTITADELWKSAGSPIMGSSRPVVSVKAACTTSGSILDDVNECTAAVSGGDGGSSHGVAALPDISQVICGISVKLASIHPGLSELLLSTGSRVRGRSGSQEKRALFDQTFGVEQQLQQQKLPPLGRHQSCPSICRMNRFDGRLHGLYWGHG